MTDIQNYPKQSNYETTLAGPITASQTAGIEVITQPGYTPTGETIRVTVLNPKGVEHFTCTGWTDGVFTGVVRGLPLYTGGASSARAHGAGIKVIIGNPWQLYDDMATAINSKLDETDGVAVTPGKVAVYASLAALNAAYPTPANGKEAYCTAEGKFYDSIGGAWVARESGGTFANMSETVAGKGEAATLAEQGAHTETGGTGALLMLQSKNTIKTPGTYTPAYMTGGSSATNTFGTWAAVTNGSFTITIDGVVRNITGLNFSSVASMANVATIIQTGIRAATGSTETCTWVTDHFVITSVNTTSASQVSVTSATGSGTDISGVGGTAFMDSETGRGTATTKILDQTFDANKTLVAGDDGRLTALLAPKVMAMSLVAGEAMDGTTTPVAVYVSDGSNSRTTGRVYKGDADDTTNMAVRFHGFIKENVAVGDTVTVYYEGVVNGFSGLTRGVKYHLSGTAGAIAAAVANVSVTVGLAISTTELLIHKETLIAEVSHATALTAGSMPLTVQTFVGFRPKAIIAICGFTEGAATTGAKNIAAFLYGGGAQGAAHMAMEGTGSDGAATNAFRIYTDEGTALAAYFALAVTAVDDTSFSVQWSVSGGANNITPNVYYLVFG